MYIYKFYKLRIIFKKGINKLRNFFLSLINTEIVFPTVSNASNTRAFVKW